MKETQTKLKQKIKGFPDEPGIYLFFDTQKELIYVGKATSLKHRVRSYFTLRSNSGRASRPIEQMMHKVASIKYKQTDSVLEAIILEANYIKKHQPRYNVMGKDNKSWNYITIGNEEYPIVGTYRHHQLTQKTEDEIKNMFKHVFGPYPGLNTKATMKLLTRMFHISFCQKKRKKKSEKGKPCLYRQMNQCLGVCTKEISSKDYKQKVIRPLTTFLRGGKKKLIAQIERDMKKAAKAEQFEDAARLRDQLRSLERIHDVTLINKSFFKSEKIQSSNIIQKIEGYDISNLGKTGKVGSMVVFIDGEPDKSQYRKFKIKTVTGQSDVDCLDEVLTRRLKHDEWPLPDLFLIDGGLPQVNRIKRVLKKHKVNIPVLGIAKGPDRKKNEFILGTEQKDVVNWIYKNTKTLIKVRDEAHRFAIKFQRQQRKIR